MADRPDSWGIDIEKNIKEYKEAQQQLFERVYKCLEELDNINHEYASWDEWDKTKIIDKARNAIAEGFEKEIMEKLYLKESK